MTANRPNILYLHSHDTGRYIQPYGYDVPTPNLQRFAEEGVLFRQAFCAEMKERLQTWMAATDDPILKGLPLTPPKGAMLADPDGLEAAIDFVVD